MTDETDKSKVASIKFTKNQSYDNGRDPVQNFEAGVTYHDLPLRFADRWVKRGVAEFASEEDAIKARGASSDVNLKLSDDDRGGDGTSQTLREGVQSSGESDAARAEREANEAAAGRKAGDNSGSTDYESMKVADLKSMASDRGVTAAGTAKADYVKALQRDDEIKTSLAAGNFDDLTVAELTTVAEQQNIDLTGKTAKADVVEAVKAGYKAPSASTAG